MQGILTKGWTAQDGGVNGTWKVSDCMKGVTRFSRDYIEEKGRPQMDLFWSLALPDGIKCTLGVSLGTIMGNCSLRGQVA